MFATLCVCGPEGRNGRRGGLGRRGGKVRLVFLGTPRAAVPALDALVAAGHDVRLAVTQPDRPAGRSRRPVASPVKRFAVETGIEVHQPRRARDDAFRDRLAAIEPELLVVVAYGRILPDAVLALGRHGAVNVHFSLLPAYRGAAPVQWTLARGETVTGVTTMLMNNRMDEGDLLLQEELPIEEDEHAPALEERLARLGAELILNTLDGLAAGSLEPRPQDHSRATYAPRLTRADGVGDPSMAASEIVARVRGFDPWPGVWMRRAARRLRVVDAHVAQGSPLAEPAGRLIEMTAEGPVMVCGQGSRLVLLGVQLEGRRPIGGRDAVHGRQLSLGDRLEGAPDAA